MTDAEVFLWFVGTAAVGAVVGGLVYRWRARIFPASLVRVNVRGKEVPAILGEPLVAASVAGPLGLLAADALEALPEPARLHEAILATLVVAVALWAAGSQDDRRGDERERGFKGHLRALASGRITGGGWKILAGALSGLVAGLVVASASPARVIGVALLVAAGANLLNLTDRAPGRAGKFFLLAGLPLAFAGEPAWTLAAASTFGGLAFLLAIDLDETAMLGDAGANPLGGILGLGLGMSLEGAALWVAVAVVVALNLASEKWSFSQVIQQTPPLRALDRLGRRS